MQLIIYKSRDYDIIPKYFIIAKASSINDKLTIEGLYFLIYLYYFSIFLYIISC